MKLRSKNVSEILALLKVPLLGENSGVQFLGPRSLPEVSSLRFWGWVLALKLKLNLVDHGILCRKDFLAGTSSFRLILLKHY